MERRPEAEVRHVEGLLAGLRTEREQWMPLFRDLADFFLPRRLPFLQNGAERSARNIQNTKIVNGSGTIALRVLVAGLMNGITSPARPWLRLGLEGRLEEPEGEIAEWLDETARRASAILNLSNFYRSIAIVYLDLALMGTSAALVYEDFDDIVRFYNASIGEFMVGQDARQEVNLFAREFSLTLGQVRERWPALPEQVMVQLAQRGSVLRQSLDISHLIEPNEGQGAIRGGFSFREYYWIKGTALRDGFLSVGGFRERPFLCPRWDTIGNDSYGTSICLDALADVKQLQQETIRKAQGLDKLVTPPLLADVQLQHRPNAFLSRGVTYVAGVNNVGVKPIYEIRLPLRELSDDIATVENRIRQFLHNDLFRGISDLGTVRSASEIEARLREQLVLLGPFLERFEHEALDPAVRRVLAIMRRKGLMPSPPPGLESATISVRYRSLLGDAARAAATGSTERFLAMLAQLVPVEPELRLIPDFEEIVRDYAAALNVPAKQLNRREEVEEMRQQQRQLAQAQAEAQLGATVAQGAATLAQAETGAGRNALQEVLGV